MAEKISFSALFGLTTPNPSHHAGKATPTYSLTGKPVRPVDDIGEIDAGTFAPGTTVFDCKSQKLHRVVVLPSGVQEFEEVRATAPAPGVISSAKIAPSAVSAATIVYDSDDTGRLAPIEEQKEQIFAMSDEILEAVGADSTGRALEIVMIEKDKPGDKDTLLERTIERLRAAGLAVPPKKDRNYADMTDEEKAERARLYEDDESSGMF